MSADADARADADADAYDEPALIVSNEFATVAVQKVQTGSGERLEVRSLRPGGRAIRLDALVLESLTWRTVLEVGEEGLRTPFGPTADEEPAPLLRVRPAGRSGGRVTAREAE